jgi:hypothetical protein
MSGQAALPPLLRPLLDISDWITTIDLPSNNVTHGSTIPRSIFINGNLARVLLASYRLVPEAEQYLDISLRWCDKFCTLQNPITTAHGLQGGWWDTGYNDLFLADTGTAVVTLVMCYQMAGSNVSRAATYSETLRRYTTFVTDGCVTAPANGTYGKGCPQPGSGSGWVHANASDAEHGALGDG